MKLKLFIAGLVAAALTLITTSAFAADIKYVYSTEKMLDKGIVYTEYDMFMSDRRWVKAYVAKAELYNEHLDLQVLNDTRGTSYLSSVSDIANVNDTSVAVNADFFAWGQSSGRGTPIGAVFFDNAMRSSPATEAGMYSIIEKNNGEIFTDIIDYTLEVAAPNGNKLALAAKNKLTDLSVPTLYDSAFASSSLGSTETQYEAVVRNGILEEIRFQSEPIALTDNMYVICGLSDWNTFMLDNFQIGDKVIIDTKSSVTLNDISLIAGAGARLLADGNIPSSFSHNISSLQPRTVFGIASDNKTVYLAVIDGRSSVSGGMSMTETAEFMRYIGAYNAVNLDGGGSSTFVAKNKLTSSQRVMNTPSDGGERRVSSVLAVTSSAKPTGELYHLSLTADDTSISAGSSTALSISGFDEYYNSVPVDMAKLTYSVSGADGYVSGNTFYANGEGIAKISARMPNGANTTLSVRVWNRNLPDAQDKTDSSMSGNAVTGFAVFGNVRESDTLFNNLIMKKSLAKISSEADKAFILATHPTGNIAPNIGIDFQACYPYNSYVAHNSAFIILDTEDDFMSSKEWTWLIDTANSTDTKNMFVFMQTRLAFSREKETQLLKSLLSDVSARGINVYLFSIGDKTECVTENGVRYITTSGFSDDIGVSGFSLTKDKLKYVLVSISADGSVEYSFRSVY